jgi:hypothetical protein
VNSTITVKHTIFIKKEIDQVWDFTQDYEKRSLWDPSIVEAKIIQTEPHRLVWIKGKWGLETQLKYKAERKPNKTSLAMVNTTSYFLEGGGGSWTYVKLDSGTEWTQTNSLILKKGILASLLKPIIRSLLIRDTQLAMRKAKALIENA